MNRFRKIILPLLTLLIAILLSGCVRLEADITIKKDGKADVSILMAYSDQLGSGSGSISEEEIAEYEAGGFIYEEYHEDGYSGFTLKGTDIGVSSNGVDVLGKDDILRKEGNKYILSLDIFSDMSSETLGYFSSISSYGGYMRLNLNLPKEVKILKSNATETNGNTLTWDILKLSNGEEIYAEFTINTMLFVKLFAVAGAAFLILVTVIISVTIVILKKRKR
ncbi:MAG: hypothetical protein Q4C42_09435 [Clostridia bacterium]|nr:hypothetical protein [Clostridia bacterium]